MAADSYSTDNEPCEVPLIEQLRSIPKEYRTVRAIQWSDDGRETGHQFIPVGIMMHRAADEIERLSGPKSEPVCDELCVMHIQDAERYRWLRDSPSDGPGLVKADLIYLQHKHGRELDDAIDAAMKEKS